MSRETEWEIERVWEWEKGEWEIEREWVLSIEMKTKVVQHVNSDSMRDWKSVIVRKSEWEWESKIVREIEREWECE